MDAEYKFPDDFTFGVATASYQIEGGWNANGKGENIWDHYIHTTPEVIKDRSNGDVACDSYNKWSEDVGHCKDLGVNFYRFSLSWSRILPNGTTNFVNDDGIKYYNNLINGLVASGIEPYVTLYHWDLPQPLQELGGWSNIQIAEYFEDFAHLCFKYFGDRVKLWITFNSPDVICKLSYGDGDFAPAIKAKGIGGYLCGKTVLLAHARVYHLYQEKFKDEQKGLIGITLTADWGEPKTKSNVDIEAAERKMQAQIGWFANPIYSNTGNYPEEIIQRVAKFSIAEGFLRSRLPPFTQEEIDFIRGTANFFGINMYTAFLIEHKELPMTDPPSFEKDLGVQESQDLTWECSAADWIKVVPWSMRKMLNWIKKTYNNPIVYITENGYADKGELNDQKRITFHREYLKAVLESIHEDKCNVKSYAAWSLIDNFEWLQGYTEKFGLYHVDFNSPNKTRTPKASASFYKEIISSRMVPEELKN